MTATRTQEYILGAVIAAELLVFAWTGENFLSVGNLFECVRLATELGLLALAMTPVIVTGGIDLSVGSSMGLCAVCFGVLLKDVHWPTFVAVACAIAVGLAGGLLNAALIARLKVSPLIVTLGTYSLFRGIAEGITKGARNYSDFPPVFLHLGQAYLGGIVPTQSVVLAIAILFFWALLHRTIVGREIFAIGHGYEGARFAAIPVVSRVALVYVLSGVSAGIAAVIYVAHLGQAKSDAGAGYELVAITAVVLGGTSIRGGVGSILGTILGLTAITLLQNGLRLSGWPTEVAGIVTGALLVLTIILQSALSFGAVKQAEDARSTWRRSGVIGVAAALLLLAVVGAFTANSRGAASGSSHTKGRITVGVMPKAKGDPYFMSCRVGAERAARDLNVELIWDGPTGLDAAKQNEIVEGWITRGVDAISVAVENAPGISTVLRKARSHGIKTVTWDADAQPDARDFFVNQATPQGIGYTLVDEAARLMHGGGEFAIITGALSAANQNQWIAFMRQRVAEKYPDLKLDTVRPSDDDRDKSFSETQTLLKVYPELRTVIAISAPAVPGAGEAIRQADRKDVNVIGLSLPSLCKPYVSTSDIKAVVLWNTADLGYLSVAVPAALVRGSLKPGSKTLNAGPLGIKTVAGSEVILGQPLIFRKDNIGQYNF